MPGSESGRTAGARSWPDRAGRTLVVTNDFPPRRGGIESFVLVLCERLDPDQVVVYTASMPGQGAVDRSLPFTVLRDRRTTLLPTPRVARSVVSAARTHGCGRVLFGAAAPLGLLARQLRRAGIRPAVAMTHGHEVWWASIPGARSALRRIAEDVDSLTYVSEYCHRRIGAALPQEFAASMRRLSPGVDVEDFAPDQADRLAVRRRLGIGADAPVVLAASRLVRRKGHDVILSAWPRVLAFDPSSVLLIVGDGPSGSRLMRSARELGIEASVRFVGGVPWAEMPAFYVASDVFALPCRTRLWGLEPEALGIVFLEAAAAGLPVIVGRSGGAVETVVDGQTGYVVDPRSPAEIASRITALIADPAAAADLGSAGREHVAAHFSWSAAISTLEALLGDQP